MEGHLIQTHENDDWLEPYFAVLKDGSYDIRDYGTPTDDVAEAISGPFWLLKDGQIQSGLDASYKAPRNSIGLKADGTLVIFMADGRQGLSDGMTVYRNGRGPAGAGLRQSHLPRRRRLRDLRLPPRGQQ